MKIKISIGLIVIISLVLVATATIWEIYNLNYFAIFVMALVVIPCHYAWEAKKNQRREKNGNKRKNNKGIE